jgi:hypothetical protein
MGIVSKNQMLEDALDENAALRSALVKKHNETKSAEAELMEACIRNISFKKEIKGIYRDVANRESQIANQKASLIVYQDELAAARVEHCELQTDLDEAKRRYFNMENKMQLATKRLASEMNTSSKYKLDLHSSNMFNDTMIACNKQQANTIRSFRIDKQNLEKDAITNNSIHAVALQGKNDRITQLKQHLFAFSYGKRGTGSDFDIDMKRKDYVIECKQNTINVLRKEIENLLGAL